MHAREKLRMASIHFDAELWLQPIIGNRRVYYAVKRVMDIVLATSLLLCLLPLMVVVGLAIFIYSPGPIFFVQERVGARRRSQGGLTYWEPVVFPCYKFRTMKVNVDPSIHQAYIKALIENDEAEMQAVQQAASENPSAFFVAPGLRKLTNDARIIAPGKFLRKFSIDELPQLWNVICGDMSMIGPRPAIPYEVEMYKPWHLQRLQAQPGITGLQQVTARCTADFDEQIRLDIEYIKNQSLWLDLKIAFKTPFAIIAAKGAH